MTDSNFNLQAQLARLGLTAENSVIISSGILNALGIRKSGDVDVVVGQADYERLSKNDRFTPDQNYGHPVLLDDTFEICTSWGVLDKEYSLQDFLPETTVIGGVRYISLDFLYRVKKSWLQDDDVRQKDIDDVKLIEEYLKRQNS
ncbi:MAG TPA: hypothetical protein VFO38_02300 [Candidatus Saccharimonadales bacterium]|nr:hypothetical protein [Candidatus Saccharimonadales bacterium]